MVFEKSKLISQHDNATLILRVKNCEKNEVGCGALFISKYSFNLTLHLQNHMKTSSSDHS